MDEPDGEKNVISRTLTNMSSSSHRSLMDCTATVCELVLVRPTSKLYSVVASIVSTWWMSWLCCLTFTNHIDGKQTSRREPKPEPESSRHLSPRTNSALEEVNKDEDALQANGTAQKEAKEDKEGDPLEGNSLGHVKDVDASSFRSSVRLSKREVLTRNERLLHHYHKKRKFSAIKRANFITNIMSNRITSGRVAAATLRDCDVALDEQEVFAEMREMLWENIAKMESLSHGSIELTSDVEEMKKDLMSDHTLRRFLIARNWDMEASEHMLLEYYRWRSINPVGGIPESSITKSLEADKVFMLGEKDWQQRPVLVVLATRHIVDNQPLDETIRFVQYCTDKIMHIALDDENDVSKMCVFVDLRKVGGHCLDKGALLTMLELMNNYFPERLGTAILWKPPTIFWLAWKLLHNFVPTETRKRMCFAYKPKDVAKFMDPAFVPKLLGGTADNEQMLIPVDQA